MHPTYSHTNLIRHFLRPTRGGAAAVVVVFAFLYLIAFKAGLIGIPLALILTSWFFKYAYILFDHTARGYDEPPTLDIQMVNPFDEQRPLGQVIIMGLIFLVLKLAAGYVGMTAAVFLALFAAVCLPASVAVLGLEGNILKAAYPIAWLRIIAGLGWMYALVLALIVGDVVLLSILGKMRLWFPIEAAIAMFAILSIFSVLAGAIYERRDELGLETWVSPERTEERLLKEDLYQNQTVVTEAYGLLRANAHVKCWDMLQGWLASRCFEPADYHWLCERVASWDDPRYITRLTEDYVARLLVLKRTGDALKVLSARLNLDPKFRPKSSADTLTLAQLAARGGGSPRLARFLLADFPNRFPGDPRVAIADALSKHLGSHTH